MKRIWGIALVIVLIGMRQAMAVDGLVELKSPRSAPETMDRVEAIARERGLTIFARVDHAAGAASVGQSLRPTELIVFGNARGGTPLMECAQTMGIDLPLKILVWQDGSGQVWLGYNDPSHLARRHGVTQCGNAVEALSRAVVGIAQSAVGR